MSGERTLAALMALLLLFTGVAPIAGAALVDSTGPGVADYDGESYDDGNVSEPADRAFVTESGDVVLVYEYDDEDDGVSGHVGTNVSEGLAHLDVTKSEAPENVTGDLTAVASPDRLDANASFSVPRPDTVDALTLDAETLVDDSNRKSSVEMDATLSTEEGSGLPAVESVTTSGHVESSAETVTANGSVTVDAREATGEQFRHSVVVTEADNGYQFDIEQSYKPGDESAWDSREAATRTLNEQYCDLGGFVDCSVSLDSYEFSDGRLDIAYGVSYDGAKELIDSALPLALSSSEAVSSEDANRMADRLSNVTLDRVAAEVAVSDGTTQVTWNATVSGVDDLALAYADALDIVAAFEERAPASTSVSFGGPFGPTPEEQADRLRTQVQAQRASGLTGNIEWDASLEASGDATEIDLSITSSAANWGEYVDELEARDGFVPAKQDTTLTVETDGDRIEMDGEMSVRKDNLFERFSTERLTQRMDPQKAEKFEEALTAVENAAFQRARADVVWDGETTEMEAAVAAENASALTAQLPKNLSAVESTHTDLGERVTYVRLGGVVDADATIEDVRELALVGDSTTVSLAGEYEREFPAMDTQYVREYLGLTGNGSGFPTTAVAGGAVAVTAAAGGLLLFSRFG